MRHSILFSILLAALVVPFSASAISFLFPTDPPYGAQMSQVFIRATDSVNDEVAIYENDTQTSPTLYGNSVWLLPEMFSPVSYPVRIIIYNIPSATLQIQGQNPCITLTSIECSAFASETKYIYLLFASNSLNLNDRPWALDIPNASISTFNVIGSTTALNMIAGVGLATRATGISLYPIAGAVIGILLAFYLIRMIINLLSYDRAKK
jgi:hypothetical protein